MMKRLYIAALVLPLLAMCGQPEEEDDNYIVTTDEFSPEKKAKDSIDGGSPAFDRWIVNN